MQALKTETIPIYWNHESQSVFIIDQTLLPYELKWVEIKNHGEMAVAIEKMLLRGAPLIGIAAAYGMVLALQEFIQTNANYHCLEKDHENNENIKNAVLNPSSKDKLINFLNQASSRLLSTRPTAVNLAWALGEMAATIQEHNSNIDNKALQISLKQNTDLEKLHQILLNKAIWIQEDDYNRCKAMSEHALKLVKEDLALKIKETGKLNVLTHCNAGALATGGYGTALGLIRSLHRASLLNMVYSDETRPRQQGSRLTAWELAQEDIPVTMICDTMAGFIMDKGLIDLVVVGSDRITLNGDVANKIGTYQVAILAKHHRIPFYVLAPESTIDLNLKTGHEIEIEYRNTEEVSHINGKACTFIKSNDENAEIEVGEQCQDLNSVTRVKFLNPGFDVTPNSLISEIITENGVKVFNN
ncbi:MAG: S-methyl-5-thioribose-1-phosphate isomerase [Candidatus Melainabacteria bacterium]|nr:S-methyl-5-thioribose-1-phosphate isomerase [Candidatus Melainabacteria bacterium]